MKNLNMWTKRAARAALVGLLLHGAWATAQDVRGPTRILVPFVAGGATDIVARQLAQRLGDMWGTPVIVENRAGAAGTIASRQLVGSAPDGKTLIMVTSSHAINELIYAKLPYSTLNDFTPIAQVTEISNVLLANTKGPYKTVTDVIAAGKAKPDSLSYGTAGAGTSVHLAGELFSAMTGVKMVPVHYKGDGESIVALAGGHIPLSFNTVPGARALINAGTVRPIAVTSSNRSQMFKDVPTIAESGVPNYAVSNWFGVLGPAKMEPAVVAKLNADIRTAFADPVTVKKLEDAGIAVKTGSAADFDRLIRNDIAKWRPIIAKLGLRGAN